MNRQKDIQYSSRSNSHIARQRQLHKLRHVITQLAQLVPPGTYPEQDLEYLASYGCVTKMHVIRLMAPALDNEDHSKDVDFSPSGIRGRWQAGYRDTLSTLEQAPWRADADPLEGFILHETLGGELVEIDA